MWDPFNKQDCVDCVYARRVIWKLLKNVKRSASMSGREVFSLEERQNESTVKSLPVSQTFLLECKQNAVMGFSWKGYVKKAMQIFSNGANSVKPYMGKLLRLRTVDVIQSIKQSHKALFGPLGQCFKLSGKVRNKTWQCCSRKIIRWLICSNRKQEVSCCSYTAATTANNYNCSIDYSLLICEPSKTHSRDVL